MLSLSMTDPIKWTATRLDCIFAVYRLIARRTIYSERNENLAKYVNMLDMFYFALLRRYPVDALYQRVY